MQRNAPRLTAPQQHTRVRTHARTDGRTHVRAHVHRCTHAQHGTARHGTATHARQRTCTHARTHARTYAGACMHAHTHARHSCTQAGISLGTACGGDSARPVSHRCRHPVHLCICALVLVRMRACVLVFVREAGAVLCGAVRRSAVRVCSTVLWWDGPHLLSCRYRHPMRLFVCARVCTYCLWREW